MELQRWARRWLARSMFRTMTAMTTSMFPAIHPFRIRDLLRSDTELICRDLMPEKNWILSGGIVTWTPCPPLDFTCIVFLYVPTEVRMERLRRRERKRFGNRIDEDGDMYLTHKKFIDWASRYDTGDIEGKTLARHEAYLRRQQIPVLEYRGIAEVTDITSRVLRAI